MSPDAIILVHGLSPWSGRSHSDHCLASWLELDATNQLETCAHGRRSSWSNPPSTRRSVHAMKPLGLVDEESEQCDAPGEDDVTDSPQALPKDRRDESRRAEAVSVGETA